MNKRLKTSLIIIVVLGIIITIILFFSLYAKPNPPDPPDLNLPPPGGWKFCCRNPCTNGDNKCINAYDSPYNCTEDYPYGCMELPYDP